MPDPEPFLALITPVDPGNAPDQGLPAPQPPTWGGDEPDAPAPPAGLWPPLPPDLPTQLPIFGGWKPGTVWPPLKPPHVDIGLPEGPPDIPVAPDQPPPPVADNTLPGGPPAIPVAPDQPPPPTVGGGPVTPPPTVGGGPVMPSTMLVLLAWVPGSGFRWVAVDTSLKPDNALPAPPTAEPK